MPARPLKSRALRASQHAPKESAMGVECPLSLVRCKTDWLPLVLADGNSKNMLA